MPIEGFNEFPAIVERDVRFHMLRRTRDRWARGMLLRSRGHDLQEACYEC